MSMPNEVMITRVALKQSDEFLELESSLSGGGAVVVASLARMKSVLCIPIKNLVVGLARSIDKMGIATGDCYI